MVRVVVATHDGTPPLHETPVPPMPVPKRLEVAMAVGTAEPAVPLAMRVFAACAASKVSARAVDLRAQIQGACDGGEC